MKKLKAFNLSRIEPELWREFKTACAYYDISIRGTLINYIQNVVDDYLKDRSMSSEPKIKTEKGGKK
jgi:hypothetical protein